MAHGICVKCGGVTDWGESGPQYLCEECQKPFREAYQRSGLGEPLKPWLPDEECDGCPAAEAWAAAE